MAQPSVAREPSMEEILASIRRIIESNDPVNGASQPQDLSQLSDDDGEADRGYDGGDFVAANDAAPSFPVFQREMPQAEATPRREMPQAEAEDMPKSVSLADLAARVRSASERMERPVQTPMPQDAAPIERREPVSEGRAPEAPSMSVRLAEFRQPELRAAQPAEAQMPPSLRPSVETPRPLFAEPEAPLARIASVDVRVEPKAPAIELSADEPMETDDFQMNDEDNAGGRDLTALVSAATVEQVSRSFSELAAAFDGTERRSLDEMAEEMLRPMLKDWLDDNLPTLVERLVREEIERVARGPRR
ncbi:PopZ family protein [Rhizobium rosettiformans]|uniref:PopZ family protein n=1 Tax=Rhizobium rosettiformans TaxID=1368430 RepID=UPI00286572EB|nr:PopZ family protein [Rhizobium rosettiformans]MDR7027382.1 cell pole-organizing protein PopZ [Rhizobium rosettiformans]MDR7065503.1 cell pole-organizing protein PopZ [Rhizobium rosettiformans]